MTNGWFVIKWRPDREEIVVGEAILRIPHKAKKRINIAIKAPKDVKIWRRRFDD